MALPEPLQSLPAAPLGGESQAPFEALLALGLYVAIAVFLIGTLMGLCWWLGHKTRSPAKGEPYESGVLPTGAARLREPVPFYLVAIFFIVFDVEAIFIVSWAVAWDLLSWAGFAQISFFIVILFLGLVYLWKMGGLEWGPRAHYQRRGKERSG
ncbi:NADH-quinone oxidoreductase subunit A 2 [Desulfuromonas versatilis]|uniref:NADH-quinone oxidoreductase subunit A n=1 Tax=Desulfuromonas versatilis TaxID=2802975 RepID=A0ABN6DTA4_9BACT|nr:NADH-quinone oxidoreductase subunit A [Desulfuromonas versatilis]BCR03388.1 NADH-quinone oxidoreductase subunit A 2 [Desulfuromonas versatilis]